MHFYLDQPGGVVGIWLRHAALIPFSNLGRKMESQFYHELAVIFLELGMKSYYDYKEETFHIRVSQLGLSVPLIVSEVQLLSIVENQIEKLKKYERDLTRLGGELSKAISENSTNTDTP